VDESILFFFRVSLSKFSLEASTFCGYKSIYSRVSEECEQSVFIKQGILATRARDWNKSRVNCLASLKVLSYSALAGVTLQLPCMLDTCATFGNSPVTRSNRKALLECTLAIWIGYMHWRRASWAWCHDPKYGNQSGGVNQVPQGFL